MARLRRFAEKVRENFVAEVEVKINFRAPPMRVAGERIPDVAGFERGQAHDQLTALNTALMDEFIDRALVGSFHRTEIHRRGFGRFHHRGGMRGVRGTT